MVFVVLCVLCGMVCDVGAACRCTCCGMWGVGGVVSCIMRCVVCGGVWCTYDVEYVGGCMASCVWWVTECVVWCVVWVWRVVCSV